jgi:hypothetical protein
VWHSAADTINKGMKWNRVKAGECNQRLQTVRHLWIAN